MSVNMYEYHTIYDRTLRSGNPVPGKTLHGWHERACLTRNALLLAKEAYERDLAELRETYTPKAFAERRQEADTQYRGLVDVARKRIVDDLEVVLESKRQQFDRSNSAPSEEVLRLLQTLSMRDTLTVGEVAAISGKLENNIPGMRLLKDICSRHGITIPDIGDPAEFERMMTAAQQFAEDRLACLDTDPKDLGYKEKLFWERPGEGEDRYFFGALDAQGFTSEQVQEATEAAQRPTWTPPATTGDDQTGTAANDGAGDVWAEVTVRHGSLYSLARQFHVTEQQVRDANPGKYLDSLYPGEKILVPSTRFTYQPDPSGHLIQPGDVRPVPAPKYEVPLGPGGAEPGDDIQIFPEA